MQTNEALNQNSNQYEAPKYWVVIAVLALVAVGFVFSILPRF